MVLLQYIKTPVASPVPAAPGVAVKREKVTSDPMPKVYLDCEPSAAPSAAPSPVRPFEDPEVASGGPPEPPRKKPRSRL